MRKSPAPIAPIVKIIRTMRKNVFLLDTFLFVGFFLGEEEAPDDGGAIRDELSEFLFELSMKMHKNLYVLIVASI